MIIGLKQDGSSSEIKDLQQKQLAIGKVHKADWFFELTETNDIKQLCSLEHNNTSYNSYTFCTPSILNIINLFGPGS